MYLKLQNLCNFLAQPNSLTHLDLSGTDTTLECVSGICIKFYPFYFKLCD